jgi:hypothetical protein
MALVITAGDAGATGNVTSTAGVQVVAGGSFGDNRVVIELEADGVRAAVHVMNAVGGVAIDCVSGTVVHATVTGSGSSAIDVSIL